MYLRTKKFKELREDSNHSGSSERQRDTQRDTQCTGKQQYLAFIHASKVVRRWKGITAGISIYRCRYCHYWHIGRDMKDERKPKYGLENY